MAVAIHTVSDRAYSASFLIHMVSDRVYSAPVSVIHTVTDRVYSPICAAMHILATEQFMPGAFFHCLWLSRVASNGNWLREAGCGRGVRVEQKVEILGAGDTFQGNYGCLCLTVYIFISVLHSNLKCCYTWGLLPGLPGIKAKLQFPFPEK